jgi:ATP synthase protein I
MADERPRNGHRLREIVDKQQSRQRKAERERTSLLAQTAYLGTLGLLLVLPVVGGAYLGLWLDERLAGAYSVRFTVGFIFLGVIIGAVNVWLFIRE